jgi:hypothetical protein
MTTAQPTPHLVPSRTWAFENRIFLVHGYCHGRLLKDKSFPRLFTSPARTSLERVGDLGVEIVPLTKQDRFCAAHQLQ